MKLAIIGSRTVNQISIELYIPENTTEIVSGGAKGVDTLAREFAEKQGLPLTEFLPDYARYRRAAPIKRNEEIADYADEVLAFWDGHSKGTAHTLKEFERRGKKVTVISVSPS